MSNPLIEAKQKKLEKATKAASDAIAAGQDEGGGFKQSKAATIATIEAEYRDLEHLSKQIALLSDQVKALVGALDIVANAVGVGLTSVGAGPAAAGPAGSAAFKGASAPAVAQIATIELALSKIIKATQV
jgi:hypothetical protein